MEAMATESIVAADWELDGFLAKLRWPIRVDGGYSDIDVVGISAEGQVRLAECKVRMGPRLVYVLREQSDFVEWLGSWGNCVANIARLWNDPPPWLPTMQATNSVEMWFCANLWFDTEAAQDAAQRQFTKFIQAQCPTKLRSKVSGRVISTRDVILSIVKRVRSRIIDDAHGRRFGNPVLDVIRELIRFSNPRPKDGGKCRQQIIEQTQAGLLEALGLSCAGASELEVDDS